MNLLKNQLKFFWTYRLVFMCLNSFLNADGHRKSNRYLHPHKFDPKPDSPEQFINIPPNVYRFNYTLRTNTFTDEDDGDMLNLAIEWLLPNGKPVPKDNWIVLSKNKRQFIAYVSRDEYLQKEYRYLLRASDNDGHSVNKTYIFRLPHSPKDPQYERVVRLSLQNSQFPDITNVELLFYIQEQKLLAYSRKYDQGIVDTKDFVLGHYKVNRLNNLIYIEMTWSTTAFLSDNCNTKSIVKLRSKTLGRYHAIYFAMFQPEFQFIGESEYFNGVCSYLSTDNPVVGPSSLESISVENGKSFKLKIPSDLFLPPVTGKLMPLELKLLMPDGSPLVNIKWIELVGNSLGEGYVLQGYIPIVLGNQNSNFTFRICALTPLLAEAMRFISIKIDRSSNLDRNFMFTLELSSPSTTSYTQLFYKIMTTLASYLLIDPAILFLYNLENKGYYTFVKWMLSSCTPNCNSTQINQYVNKLVSWSGKPALDLKERFDKANITLYHVHLDLEPDIRKPEIKRKLGRISLSYGTFLNYVIPTDSYIDAMDGTNLTFSVRREGSRLNSFFVDGRTIKGIVVADQFILNIIDLILRVTNRAGDYIDDPFSIVNNFDYSKWSHLYKIRFKYTDSSSSIANTLYSFTQKFIRYLTPLSLYNQDIIVSELDTENITKKSIEMFYFNSSETNSCIHENETSSYLNLYANSETRNDFNNYMKPDFEITYVGKQASKLDRSCGRRNTIKLVNRWGPLYVNIAQTFIYQVPEKTFHDYYLGFTRNLTLKIQQLNGDDLSPNFWIEFDALSQTLAILATRDIAIALPSSSLTLILIAFNNKRESATQHLEIVVNRPPEMPSHYFEMKFVVIPNGVDKTFVTLYDQLRSDIRKYFRDTTDTTLALYQASNDFNNTLTVRWANATVSHNKCEPEKIETLLERIFMSKLSRKVINPSFKAALYLINISDISFQFTGACTEYGLPPTVKNPLSPIQAGFCNFIEYKIPEDTFYDRIDGNTRELTLQFTYINGSELALDSFVSFNASTQTILVTPFESAFPPSTVFPQIYTFSLKAKAKRGLEVSTRVNINIQHGKYNFSSFYKINADWKNSDKTGRPPLTNIAKYFIMKTGNYLTDHDGRNIYLKQLARPSPDSTELTITASSCLLQFGPCDKENTDKIEQQIFSKNSQSLNTKYEQYMRPSLMLLSLTIHQKGSCNQLNNKPILVTPLADVTLNICSAQILRLPLTGFRDMEDGYDLTFRVVKINNKFINQIDSWIQTDYSHNVYTTVNNKVLSEQQNGRHVVTIRAFDKNQQFADATWNVKISGKLIQIYYTMIIELELQQDLQPVFVERFQLSDIINKFFKDNNTNAQVLRVLPEKRIRFEWSSCNLPSYCDNNAAAIYLMNMKINSSITGEFYQAFWPRYRLLDVSMKIDDSCVKPLSPPTPKQKKWIIDLNGCGVLNVTVPFDMFSDDEDGNTRNLKLELKHSSKKDLPQWLVFYPSHQVIVAFPTINELIPSNGSVLSFVLTATDKSGLSSSMDIKFDIKLPTTPKYTFQFHYNVIPNTKLTRLEEMIKFSEKLSSYLNSSIDMISVLSFTHLSFTYRTFTYGNCSIRYEPCDLSSIALLKTMFVAANGDNITKPFYNSMLPEFTLRFVTTKSEKPCDASLSPRSVEIPTLIIPFNSYYEYIIPEDTFFDQKDGKTRSMTLHLKEQDGRELTKRSWIQFDQLKQMIYAVPVAKTALDNNKGFRYRLEAENSLQFKSLVYIHVNVTGPIETIMKYSIGMNLSTTDFDSNTVQRLAFLKGRLQKYFKLPSAEEIIAIKFFHYSQADIHFAWSYYQAKQSSDVGAIKFSFDVKSYFSKILLQMYEGDERRIKKSFLKAFEPEYQIKVIAQAERDMPPVAMKKEVKITTSFCEPFSYQISDDVFNDFEEGATSNLTLQLYKTDFGNLTESDWVRFDPKKQIVQGYPRSGENPFQRSYRYKLVATDKSGGKADTTLLVYLSGFIPYPDYVLELSVNTTTNEFDLLHIQMDLIQKLSTHFQNETFNIVDLVRENENSNRLNMTFGFCYPSTSKPFCTCENLRRFQSLITPMSSLRNSLGNNYTLNYIVDKKTGSCSSDNAPSITQTLPSYTTVVGQYFSFEVPTGTFQDKEDGATPNLNLFVEVDSNNSYININKVGQKQLFCGVIPVNSFEDFRNENRIDGDNSSAVLDFMFGAQDSCGNKVLSNSSALINRTTTPTFLNFKLTLWIQINFEKLVSNCTLLHSLVKKIADYSGYDKSDIYIEQIREENDFVHVSWGYKNLSDSNCSASEVKILRHKFFDKSGDVKEQLKIQMKPFIINSVFNETLDICTALMVMVKRPVESFPWWILWLLGALSLLFLIFWLLWLCCPRFCVDVCCGGCRNTAACNAWCTPNGYYSSFDKKRIRSGRSPVHVFDDEVLGAPGTAESDVIIVDDDDGSIGEVQVKAERPYESLSDVERAKKEIILSLPQLPNVNTVKLESYRDERDEIVYKQQNSSITSLLRKIPLERFSTTNSHNNSDLYAEIQPKLRELKLAEKLHEREMFPTPRIIEDEYAIPMKRKSSGYRVVERERPSHTQSIDRYVYRQKNHHNRKTPSIIELREPGSKRSIDAVLLESPKTLAKRTHSSKNTSKWSFSDDEILRDRKPVQRPKPNIPYLRESSYIKRKSPRSHKSYNDSVRCERAYTLPTNYTISQSTRPPLYPSTRASKDSKHSYVKVKVPKNDLKHYWTLNHLRDSRVRVDLDTSVSEAYSDIHHRDIRGSKMKRIEYGGGGGVNKLWTERELNNLRRQREYELDRHKELRENELIFSDETASTSDSKISEVLFSPINTQHRRVGGSISEINDYNQRTRKKSRSLIERRTPRKSVPSRRDGLPQPPSGRNSKLEPISYMEMKPQSHRDRDRSREKFQYTIEI